MDHTVMSTFKKAKATILCALVALTLFAMPVSAKSTALSWDGAALYKGGKLALTLDGSKSTKWKSSNKKVAKVDKKGNVTAIKAGSATISIKSGKKTYECLVTVMNKKISGNNSGIAVKYTGKKAKSLANITTFSKYSVYNLNKDGKKSSKVTTASMSSDDDGVSPYYKVTIAASGGLHASLTVPNTRKSYSFKAKIYHVADGALYVRGLASNDINHRGRYMFYMSDTLSITKNGKSVKASSLKKGSIIRIYYTGYVLESDPASLPGVYSIAVL